MSEMIFFYSEKNENGYLSNWYPAEFTYDGYHYKTSEQYMMHQKALLFDDEAVAQEILEADDQLTIKRLGRKVTPFDKDTWDANKVDIVYRGLLEKFRQNEDLKEQLLSTGDATLVEAAPRDVIWGIGLGKDNPRSQDPSTWRGKNLLGYTLMKVRDTIREEDGE